MNGTRAERIASACKNVDATVIYNGSSPFLDSVFWYVTEQTSGIFEGSMAIISKDGSLDVITGQLEEAAAKKGLGNVHIYKTRRGHGRMVSDVLKGCRRIGICGRSVTYGFSEYLRKRTDAKIIDVSGKVSEVTAIKDEKEIADIRKACTISSDIASRIPEMLHDGITEKEMAWNIESEMRMKGGSGNAFDTISAFGENSAEPHYRPGDRKLKKGDAALFDFGSKYGLYCSDLTRTVFFGEPGDILRRAYDVVLNAKNAGMEKMFDGSPAKDADIAARAVIDQSEFRGRFIHSFGHGIGMDVHQGPSLYSKSKDVLKEGMIVSAEPGIYIPGLGGIRIEDTVLITEDGNEALTEFDESYTVI
ncbi:MAG: Xaa-Pro peptidase family protein [Methanomassiliicoccaceae archaeon]|nr:Xaa-Pro peptidase family protein [Methanomassiliicoccaceae archaeon]